MNKIVIVDDHSLFREGLKLLIENENLGIVVAEASNGQLFLNILQTLQPDLVIMDLKMPVMGGLEATRKALALVPNLKIMLLTMQPETISDSELLSVGAMGLVLKTSGKQVFEQAITAITAGKSYFPQGLFRRISTSANTQNHTV